MAIAPPRPDADGARYVPHPVKYSRTPPREDGAPPRLGAHTREALQEKLGLDAEELAALAASGVIG